MAAAQSAARQDGLKIYTIGVGTPQGDLIPLTGNPSGGFVKDESGAFVKSRLDEPALEGHRRRHRRPVCPARHRRAGLRDHLQAGLAPLLKHDLASRRQKIYTQRYQWPLAASLGLLLLSLLIGTRRRSPRASGTPHPHHGARAHPRRLSLRQRPPHRRGLRPARAVARRRQARCAPPHRAPRRPTRRATSSPPKTSTPRPPSAIRRNPCCNTTPARPPIEPDNSRRPHRRFRNPSAAHPRVTPSAWPTKRTPTTTSATPCTARGQKTEKSSAAADHANLDPSRQGLRHRAAAARRRRRQQIQPRLRQAQDRGTEAATEPAARPESEPRNQKARTREISRRTARQNQPSKSKQPPSGNQPPHSSPQSTNPVSRLNQPPNQPPPGQQPPPKQPPSGGQQPPQPTAPGPVSLQGQPPPGQQQANQPPPSDDQSKPGNGQPKPAPGTGEPQPKEGADQADAPARSRPDDRRGSAPIARFAEGR